MNVSELHDRIRELVLDETDPQRVATRLLDGLPSTEQRELLAIVLPAYVRSRMTEPHRRGPRPADVPQRGRVPGVYHSRDGKKYASAKRRDIADWHAITSTPLGAPGGGRKRFGDFTADEVTWLVMQREAQAEALMRRADQYRTIAKAMVEADVETVDKLNPAILVQVMNSVDEESSP